MLERIKKGSRSLHMHPAKGPRRLHMHPAKTLSKVKSTECMANAKPLAPLPLHNATHPDPAGQPCSSMVPSSTAQHKPVWPEQHHQQSLLQEQMKSYYHINMSPYNSTISRTYCKSK